MHSLLRPKGLLCGGVLFSSLLMAQNDPQRWMVRNYSVKNGLSQTSATSIAQDDMGFLWIATEDGINRFDGREFKVYRKLRLDSSFGTLTRIYLLFHTSRNLLLGGSDEHGIVVFDPVRDLFDGLPVYPDHSRDPASNVVTSFAECEGGIVLFGTQAGAFRFDPHDRSIVNLHTLFPALPRDQQVTGLAGSRGRVTITYWDERSSRAAIAEIRSDLVAASILDTEAVGLPHPMSGFFMTTMAVDSMVQIVFGDRIFLREAHEERFQEFTIPGLPGIERVMRWQDATVASTPAGLFRIQDNAAFQIPLPTALDEDASRLIKTLVRTKDGSLWAGTYNGIFQLDPHSAKFNHIGAWSDRSMKLCDPKVRGLLKDGRGRTWVGTNNGIDMIPPEGNRVISIVPPTETQRFGGCRMIVEDTHGTIWARSDLLGILRLDEDPAAVKQFTMANSGFPCDHGVMLYPNPDGTLFTGSELDLLDADQLTYHRTAELLGGPPPRTIGNPFCAFRAKDGTYWTGSLNRGVLTFKYADHRISDLRHVTAGRPEHGALSNNFVTCIRQDHAGLIWLGTYGGGLNRFDPATRRFSCLTMDDGLPNNVVYGIEIDKQDRIWFTSNAGISCFDQSDSSVRNFDVSDRVQSSEFNSNSAFQAPDGEIFFGGINGFNSFYPDSIKLNIYLPAVAFTALSIGHIPMEIGAPGSPLHRSMAYQDSLELTYEQNDLTVKFAALSFISPEKNQFAYMLSGYEDKWIQLGTQNQVSFTNLDPGRYQLHVKAANNDGLWNEEYRTLHLNILPPWYRTSQAIALFIFLTGSFLFGLGWIVLSRIRLRYQLVREHEEAEEARAQDERRSRFFINVAHDLRTPLILIKQRVEQIATHPNERVDDASTQVLRHSVDKLTGRITALLETAQQDKDHIALNAAPVHVNELLHVLVADFRPMAQSRGIDLSFVPAPGDPVADLDREKVTMALENLLNNAFKFTPDGGTVSVVASPMFLAEEVDAVRITVRDTGIGIAPEDQERVFDLYERGAGTQLTGKVGAGVGLFHVRRIAEMHGGRCSIESGIGKGTAFHLDLPLGLPEGVSSATSAFATAERLAETMVLLDPLPDAHDTRPIALVVEDDPDLNIAIAELLRAEFRTYRAHNGEEGLKKAFDLVPDVVVTDVMMPGKDGFELCRTLKADARTSHVPVIVVTAITDLEEKIRGLYDGADDFLPKPYEPRELLARARNAVARTRKVMELNRAAMSAPTAAPPDPAKEPERAFLTSVDQAITDHLDDTNLDVVKLGSLVAMSKSNLSRKLAALIGRSPGELIREKRMTTARALLEGGSCNVSETMTKVGYENLPSFSNAFKDYWGQPPSHFLKRG